MTDAQTLLLQAMRCRRMARACSTPAIARKFEALARDYEEHANRLRERTPAAKVRGGYKTPPRADEPRDAAAAGRS